MFPNIHKYIYITIAVIFIGFIGYFWYTTNSLKSERDQWKEEANKIGIALKISDSLFKYTASINKGQMDSIIKSNKDIAEQIKKGQEKPLIITVTKEKVYIEKVPADTTNPDPNDSTYRLAFAKHKDGWYELEAKYQIVKPFNFEWSKISMKNTLTTVTTQLPNGRIVVYTKSINPFITTDSTFTYIDPVMIQLPPKGPTWKWGMSALVNPWNRETDMQFGIYAPFNFGVVTSYSIYKNSVFVPPPKESFKIGLSFIKDF